MKQTPTYGRIDLQQFPFKLRPSARLLSTSITYEQALALKRSGSITERQWQWYVVLWVWGAIRFSDLEQAAKKQDDCFAAIGFQGLVRRTERMRKLHAKLWNHHFSAYFVNQPTSSS